MKLDNRDRALKWLSFWLLPLIGHVIILGGCGAKEPPLSREAQTLKKELLREMDKLTAALVEPTAKQNWEAIPLILKSSYEDIEKKGKLVLTRIGVMDRDGILQLTYPSKEAEGFDFYNFQPAKLVYINKRKAQAKLYVGINKIFILIAPLLQKDQVIGAAVVAFSDEELQNTWKVSEKEFLSIDFNG
jgi:hypothetical protein